MDKLEAAELIKQQRRRWPSEAPDEFIARRAQRGYHKMAVIFAVLGAAEAGMAALWLRGLYVMAAGFLTGAVFLYWQSRRYAKVLKVLRDAP
jgi:hypothetical protein